MPVGPPGFEPGQTESKSVVLPLHHGPIIRYSLKYLSERRDSNPQLSAWKADALAIELLSQKNYHFYNYGSSVLFEIKSSGL